VLDLGTGTGAIALSIAKHRPNALVTAVDASPEALAIAQENAQRLHIANVRFVLSDWFEALSVESNPEKYDIIASNPPYIVAGDPHLSQGDLRFEPLSALASGNDGLDDIRRIIADAALHLSAGGFLLLEHGYDQAAEAAARLSGAGYAEIHHHLDLGGIIRVTEGRWPG